MGKIESERQQKLIREFDKKHKAAAMKGAEPAQWLVIIIMESIITLLLFIPYEQEDLKMALSGMVLVPWPVMMYLSPYLYVAEGGQSRSMYEKFMYFPVEQREVRRVRIQYLLHFLRIPFALGVAGQLLMALLVNHALTLANFIYPALTAGVLPLLIGMIMVLAPHV